jgi:hypothetical protein
MYSPPTPNAHGVSEKAEPHLTQYFASEFYAAQKYPILWKMHVFILKTQQSQ